VFHSVKHLHFPFKATKLISPSQLWNYLNALNPFTYWVTFVKQSIVEAHGGEKLRILKSVRTKQLGL